MCRACHSLEELVAAGEDQSAPADVAVAADVLGRGLERDVGAERQRALERGARERVVDDRQGPCRLRHADRPRKIGHLEQRVRRALEPDDPRRPCQRLRERAGIGGVDRLGDHPPAREEVPCGHPDAVVGVVGEDHAVSRLQGLEDRRGRSHPRGKGERRFASVELRERLLELGERRAAVAEVLLRADERVRLVARERRGEVDRRGDASGRLVGSRDVDGQCLDSHADLLSRASTNDFSTVVATITVPPASDHPEGRSP